MNDRARNYLGASLIEAAYGGDCWIAIQPRKIRQYRRRAGEIVMWMMKKESEGAEITRLGSRVFRMSWPRWPLAIITADPAPDMKATKKHKPSKAKRRIDRIVKAHVKANKGKAVDVGSWIEL